MKKKILILFLILALAIVNAACGADVSTNIGTTEQNEELKIHFIDVGQADSILIELPNDEEVLIDAGNAQDADTIINYIQSLNVDTIEYFILTHPHEDHIGSAEDIINSIDIEKIYMPDVSASTKSYEKTMSAISAGNIPVIKAKAGLTILETPTINFSVLAPTSMYYSEINEYSIVTKLVYNETSFLFTGDAESVSELEMTRSGYNLNSDLLKVGHHGGRTSTSQIFLEAVTPKYAVIPSEAGNSYGHPHAETLNRLEAIGANIYRMDMLGTIIVTSDGNKITFNKEPVSVAAENPETTLPISNETEPFKKSPDIQYVGNKNSLKFHIPSCSSVDDIKKSNKIFFSNRQDAVNEGYSPCGRCKP